MKSLIIYICTVFAMFLQGFCNVDTIHEYPETFKVIVVDHEHDFIALQDFTGHVFYWSSAEDWLEGDIASAIMNSNGTETITDDRIVMLKYSGYITEP